MSEAAVAPSKVSGHTILAFDFGTRWVGVAVGDTETRIANPLGTFEAESNGGPSGCWSACRSRRTAASTK